MIVDLLSLDGRVRNYIVWLHPGSIGGIFGWDQLD